MIAEEWRAVTGYEGLYEASSLGRVKSLQREITKRTRYGGFMRQVYSEHILQPLPDRKGYLITKIGVLGSKRKIGIHELVLRAFSGAPKPNQITRHLNGNPLDNRPENLAWGTHSENMADRKSHGLYRVCGDHAMAKLTQKDVDLIREGGRKLKELSEITGVGISQVSRIRRNQNWVASHEG